MSGSVTEFLVRELRRMRQLSKLTQEEFGKACSFSATHVSSVETGHRPPTLDYLRAVDKACKTGGLFERMWTELAILDAVPDWVRERATIVGEATMLRWYEHAWVPGILQTEDYVRAVFASNRRISQGEAERRIATRLEQRQILDGEKLSLLVAVLDEALLYRSIGGPKVMHEQVEYLIQLAVEHPRVRLHVVPSSAGAYAGLNGPVIIARLPDGQEFAYLDNQLKGQVASRDTELADVRDAWEAILGEALTPQQSIDKLVEVAKTWS